LDLGYLIIFDPLIKSVEKRRQKLMLAAWVYGWIEDDLLISSIFALDVCGIRSPNAV